MARTIKINGIDMTEYFTPTGVSVSYESVQGGNAGMMMDGSYTDDELAIKATITLTCVPLNESQMNNLLQTVYKEVYPKLYYFDPRKQKEIEIETRRGNTQQMFRGNGSDGNNYWTGTQLVLKER